MILPEQFGPFRFYPIQDHWGMSWEEQWLPISLATRDACVLLAGLFLAGGAEDLMRELRETYNLARPSVEVTVAHIFKAVSVREGRR